MADKTPSRIDVKPFRVPAGLAVDLNDWSTRGKPELSKDQGEQMLGELTRRLDQLQEMLYAQGKHSLLVVLQAMDAGGKDSTIRRVFGPLNPQGVRVASFKAPSALELSHDYLWRIHAECPAKGMIRVFNRSHYEDVLIVRVKQLVEARRWKKRFGHINAFEQMLVDEGTTIVKFFLHISKDYQRKRFQRRLDRPDKHWKFNPADLKERDRWADYQHAYAEAISKTTQKHAPWYIIPAERKWYRCLAVAQVLVDTLETMDLKYPDPAFDPSDIRIK